MLVVAGVFGYLKWREQRFMADITGLGINRMEVYDGGFWATNPRYAVIFFNREGNRLSFDGKPYSPKEIEQRFQPIDKKLRSLGVENVSYLVLAKEPTPGEAVDVEQSFTDLDKLIDWYTPKP